MSLREEIRKKVEESFERLVGLAQDLVRINSENHPPGGNEGAVQKFIADFWKSNGMECDIFDPNAVPGFASHPAFYDDGRDYSNRPVVVAKLSGSGGGRSLIFNGHIDTVPAVGDWRHDPYAAIIEDGKLYGRGAFDMKGGVAAMMMAAVLLREMGIQLQGDILVETVPDEEFASSNGSVAAFARGYTADAAVVTEPSGLTVVTGQRGFRLVQVAVKGQTGIQVSGETNANPVEHLAPILQAIEVFRAARQTVTVEDTVMITKLAANEFRRDELLTVPPECRIEVQLQFTPEEDVRDVDTLFAKCIRDACMTDPYFVENPVEITYEFRPMPGSRVAENSPIVRAMACAVEGVTGSQAVTIDRFAPCDMFVFNRFAGIPALVFGPDGGGAHAPDEFVNIDDLRVCTEVYINLAVNWAG